MLEGRDGGRYYRIVVESEREGVSDPQGGRTTQKIPGCGH